MRALWNQIDGQTLLDFTGGGGDLDCKQCQFELYCNDGGVGRVWADMCRYLESDSSSLDLVGFH